MADYILGKANAGAPITDEDWVTLYYECGRKNFYDDDFVHLELMLQLASANNIELRFVELNNGSHVNYIYGFLGFSFHWDRQLLSRYFTLCKKYNINNAQLLNP